MPMITKVMTEAGAARTELTAVAVGVGPGPYTGLRVGVVTARVLGSVLGVPVPGLCSLDIIAGAVLADTVLADTVLADTVLAAGPGREFLVATDARRKEVYWARHAGAGRPWPAPRVGPAGSIPDAAGLPVAGAGGPLYPEAFG